MLVICAARLAMAAGFSLGLEYSRSAGDGILNAGATVAIGVDASGAVYLLQNGTSGPNVLKSTPTNKTAYVVSVPINPHAMAVDAAGSAYIAGQSQVAKLNPDGSTAYTVSIGDGLYVSAIAADSLGRAYVTGWSGPVPLRTTPGAFQQTASSSSHAFVVRLSASGAVDYATYVSGSGTEIANGIAVDGTGAAFIRGRTQSLDFPVTPGAYLTSGADALGGVPFVARLSPDGSQLLYAAFMGSPSETAQALAAGATGEAAVAVSSNDGSVMVLRLDAQGALRSQSPRLPPVNLSLNSEALAIDAAGTAYFAVRATTANYPVKDSVTECGSISLSAFDTSGNIVQSTYVPSAATTFAPNPAIALGLGGAVYVTSGAASLNDAPLVAKLSTATPARPVRLACIGNGASFDAGAVAPGELVSLFGQGLGPDQGTQPEVTLKDGFPLRVAGVQVTFDGVPAPLLYVQDGQVNAIVPWRLTPGKSTTICATYIGSAPGCVQRKVAVAAPGVFMWDSTHALALNEDGTLNTSANPAKAGTNVSIFATGLGPLTPTPADGAILDAPLPANTLPITPYSIYGSAIAFGLVAVPTQYAGPAPRLVAGVSQINLRPGGSTMLLGVGPQLFVTSEVMSRRFSVWVSPR
jgi:uncharacterized protein (TIGR03437 family)